MSEKLYSRWRVVARNALALLVGIAVAVALVTLWEFVSYTLAHPGPPPPEEQALITRESWVRFAAVYSAYVAIVVAFVCTPIWLLLIRFRLAGWHSAAALGFAAPVVYWALTEPMSASMVRNGLVYGLCGLAAGLATWWARPRNAEES